MTVVTTLNIEDARGKNTKFNILLVQDTAFSVYTVYMFILWVLYSTFIYLALPAKALGSVGTFSGECRISLTTSTITISDPNGVEIASWPYNAIRQFRADDILNGKFSFTSGRRGPFGVGEYDFLLAPLYFNELKSTLSRYTGNQFGTEKSPERSRDGRSPQQEPSATIEPKYGLDSESTDGQPRYVIGNRSTHDGHGYEKTQGSFSQQRNSFSSLANHYEPNRPIIKKQLTLQELHGHPSHSYSHHPYELTEIGIPKSHGESITDQHNVSRTYVEIDPIYSDKPVSTDHLNQRPAASGNVLLTPTVKQCDTDDGGSSNLDTSVRTRIMDKISTSEPSNPVYSGGSQSVTHIYDKLPPRADTIVYDTPHSSVYSVPRLSESASPPPALNVRHGHLPPSPHLTNSATLTRRPLPETPIQVEEQYASTLQFAQRDVNSGYVDIDIQESANGDVYFQMKPSEPIVVVGEEAPRFIPTPDVSSDSIAHKLATEGYELVTVARQGIRSSVRPFKELSLNKDMEALSLNEDRVASIGEDDDSDGYIVVRSLRPAVPPEPVAYENVVNQNTMEVNDDEQYATVHHLDRKGSESGLYETVQVASDHIVSAGAHPMQKPLERTFVPLATEAASPVNTAELRFRTRTVGDILDVEKHTYVNIKCEDDSTLLRKGGVIIPTKKPKPAPRNSSSPRLGSTDRESTHLEETM